MRLLAIASQETRGKTVKGSRREALFFERKKEKTPMAFASAAL